MEEKIRVNKEFTFEAAHALDGYEGKCKDIHGHSYHLTISVIGIPKTDKNLSDVGMVIDFSELKDLVKRNVTPLFDHRLILRNDSRFKGLEKENEKVRYVPYQPTCENMLLEIVRILKPQLSQNVQLHSMLLRETSTSYCEWHATDN